jgi:hypothetical protein
LSGTRKYRSVDEDKTKLTIVVPKDLDRQQLRCPLRGKEVASDRWSGDTIAEKLTAAVGGTPHS